MGPTRLVAPLEVVFRPPATMKPFPVSLIEAALRVTSPKVRITVGCALPLSSMLRPAVIVMSPPAGVAKFELVPMRAPEPVPELRITSRAALTVMVLG